MSIKRRDFLKAQAATTAAAAAGFSLPAAGRNLITDSSQTNLQWDKAPCRFCGVGCGVNVATRNGKVVATHGDIKSEVNKGLNCDPGYRWILLMLAWTKVLRTALP